MDALERFLLVAAGDERVGALSTSHEVQVRSTRPPPLSGLQLAGMGQAIQ